MLLITSIRIIQKEYTMPLLRSLMLGSLLAITSTLPATANAADLFSQDDEITRQDVLRGSITPERAWWDLSHYHLDIRVEPEKKTIAGTNTVTYRVLSDASRLQIELQAPMQLTKAVQNGQSLNIIKDGYTYFIEPDLPQPIGSEQSVILHFEGNPTEAKRAPWDGGITWTKDDNGIDFIASANQGIGASIWWPNKDHAYDEPDLGALISVEVPEHLVNVSNGRLEKTEHNKERKTKTYHWRVINPINNYGVNINIGDYVHFGETYAGESGVLDMDYYVLSYNLDKAKKQFKDAQRTIEAFEYWFGPYPFYQDSFKLVEAPYLGMEHQSSVTYGNGYQNGYLGRDRSRTGHGMLFDFIIIHETGHEWFANNITNVDIADMWIHESFTNYSESLFLEYHYDKDKAFAYVRGSRANVQNKKPIVGQYNVHREGSSDMYDKGSNMLHTIRQIIDDDKKWRDILRGLNKTFYHQTTTGAAVEAYMIEQSGKSLEKVFDQYLRDIRIPALEYFVKGDSLMVRWANTIDGFNMPMRIYVDNQPMWITPKTSWSEVTLPVANATIKLDPNFYITHLDIMVP